MDPQLPSYYYFTDLFLSLTKLQVIFTSQFFTRREEKLSIVGYVTDLSLMPRSSSGPTLRPCSRKSHK